ncbi:hypothetical protein CEXT_461141 [Caerostris extrusa]|uniref:Secreted protein n=1 Tax=Caerostris extrusa TaxID=172846 RepID=A0AAV4SHA8_CAEEX|nr:hypothetical protein CEXT_461141 [Caerostris extrusa]
MRIPFPSFLVVAPAPFVGGAVRVPHLPEARPLVVLPLPQVGGTVRVVHSPEAALRVPPPPALVPPSVAVKPAPSPWGKKSSKNRLFSAHERRSCYEGF